MGWGGTGYRGWPAPDTISNKVLVSGADAGPADWLAGKLVAGPGISLTILNPGGDEDLEVSAPGSTTDEKVKASATDLVSDYLYNLKLVAGTGITLNLLNPGANEQVQIVNNYSIGPGTLNTIPLWTGASTLGDSIITQSGSQIIVTGYQTISQWLGVQSPADSQYGIKAFITNVTGTDAYSGSFTLEAPNNVTALAVGLEAGVRTAAAAFTCSDTRGLWIKSAIKGAGSTITTNTGLYIQNQTVGATNYSIWAGSGLYHFGGVTTPSRLLQVDAINNMDSANLLNYVGAGSGISVVTDGAGGVTIATTGGFPRLDQVLNPNSNKSFNMVDNQLKFTWVQPTTADGALEMEVTGAFAGDVLHIHQHTGNPGAGDLVHLEATKNTIVPLRVIGGGPWDVIVAGGMLVASEVQPTWAGQTPHLWIRSAAVSYAATPPTIAGNDLILESAVSPGMTFLMNAAGAGWTYYQAAAASPTTRNGYDFNDNKFKWEISGSPVVNFSTTDYDFFNGIKLNIKNSGNGKTAILRQGDPFLNGVSSALIFEDSGQNFGYVFLGGFGSNQGIIVGSTNTNNTSKDCRYKTIHYNNAGRPPVYCIGAFNGTNENTLRIGGGAGQDIAATEILMYVASNTTTTTGTLTLQVKPSSIKMFLSTEDWETIDAGSAGATEQDWIEVKIGSTTGYIRVFAAK